MPDIRSLAEKVRSKNAGPFWITIDIFCGSDDVYERISNGLDTAAVAARLDVPSQTLKRFDIGDLNVVKVSIPRPQIQGDRTDRDMHGAALANIVAEMSVE